MKEWVWYFVFWFFFSFRKLNFLTKLFGLTYSLGCILHKFFTREKECSCPIDTRSNVRTWAGGSSRQDWSFCRKWKKKTKNILDRGLKYWLTSNNLLLIYLLLILFSSSLFIKYSLLAALLHIILFVVIWGFTAISSLSFFKRYIQIRLIFFLDQNFCKWV